MGSDPMVKAPEFSETMGSDPMVKAPEFSDAFIEAIGFDE